MINIRYPNITGRTPEEKVVQMERYLRQFIDELNYALRELEKKADSGSAGKEAT